LKLFNPQATKVLQKCKTTQPIAVILIIIKPPENKGFKLFIVNSFVMCGQYMAMGLRTLLFKLFLEKIS